MRAKESKIFNSIINNNEMINLIVNPSTELNLNDEIQVWPHLKENNYKNSIINSNVNKYNTVNFGADFYESNEEKITVL